MNHEINKSPCVHSVLHWRHRRKSKVTTGDIKAEAWALDVPLIHSTSSTESKQGDLLIFRFICGDTVECKYHVMVSDWKTESGDE